MKLIVVTRPSFFSEEELILSSLFEEGLDILHLRKPDTPPSYSERLLTLIPERYHKHIVLHDHYYLMHEFGVMGIHLDHPGLQPPAGYEGHLSCTCRSLQEVREAKARFDYVLLAPVNGCITLAGTPPGFTPEELRQAQRDHTIDSKVVALGGITPDNILAMKDYGFGGVAICGDLWNKFDVRTDHDYLGVVQRFRQLGELIK